jgi:hypothetical protein
MRISIILLLLFSSSLTHANIVVTFNGILDRNSDPNNPYSIGDSYSGSFELDESVINTGLFRGEFLGAVDNFSLNIAGSIFSGNNGTLFQFLDAGNAGPLSSSVIGDFGTESHGTVTGTAPNGATLHSVVIDIRGLVIPDPAVIVSAPLMSNRPAGLSYKIDLFFANSGNNGFLFSDSTIEQFNYDVVSPVPVPAAVWLFSSGLLGLIGVSRRKQN